MAGGGGPVARLSVSMRQDKQPGNVEAVGGLPRRYFEGAIDE
jgi:hypothetical protein